METSDELASEVFKKVFDQLNYLNSFPATDLEITQKLLYGVIQFLNTVKLYLKALETVNSKVFCGQSEELKTKLFEIMRNCKCIRDEPVDENAKKAIPLYQKPNYRKVMDSIYAWNLEMVDSLDNIIVSKKYGVKKTKFHSMKHTIVCVEKLSLISNCLLAFAGIQEELRLPACPPPFLIEHEFKDGYTWIVKASDNHKKILLDRMMDAHRANGIYSHNKAQSCKEGVLYIFFSPWNSNDLLGFFVLNRNIETPHRMATFILIHYMEVRSDFRGCGVGSMAVDWIKSKAKRSGCNNVSVVRFGPPVKPQDSEAFWVKNCFQHSGINTWMECDI